MPRRAKGARLWLRKPQRDKSGALTHAAVWIIKDGRYRESTGCSADDHQSAEDRLAEYIASKRIDHMRDGIRPPATIPVADVLALYSRDCVDQQVRPNETTRRLNTLLTYFHGKVLSDINGDLCRKYATDRGHPAAARRELEDLRSAVIHHRKEGLCSAIVEIVLPPRGAARERWLTRTEAARLILAAWRYRETFEENAHGFRGINVIRRPNATYYYAWRDGPRIYAEHGTPEFQAEYERLVKDRPRERYPRRHIAKFLLTAFYTTSRSDQSFPRKINYL